jgi:hypothetical protein
LSFKWKIAVGPFFAFGDRWHLDLDCVWLQSATPLKQQFWHGTVFNNDQPRAGKAYMPNETHFSSYKCDFERHPPKRQITFSL